jgi:hypothetical protein
MDGRNWIPYQPAQFPTPAFPEFVSGHSAFSAAAAEVLRLFSGSDYFGETVTFPAGTSNIERGITPASTVTLHWWMFSEAADEAGFSRPWAEYTSGWLILPDGVSKGSWGGQAWRKASNLWSGRLAGLRQEIHEGLESRW